MLNFHFRGIKQEWKYQIIVSVCLSKQLYEYTVNSYINYMSNFR